jgi:hydrophobe/amphiphile efflux-3 (HAE3) family protein
MRALFIRLGRFVEARPGSILAVTAVLIALALLGATRTHIDTTVEAFVDPGSDTARNSEAYSSAFGADPVVVMIPGTPQELTSPETLDRIESLTGELSRDGAIRSCVSVLTLLTATPLPEGTDLDQPGVATAVVFDADGEPRATFASLFPSGHELVQISIKPGLSVEEQGKVADRVQAAVKAAGLPEGTVVAGYPRLYGEIASSIVRDMAVTAGVAVLLMIAVLYIVFPVRRRLMSLPVVVVGTLFTFGFTGAAGISLTLVTMAGLPILLGLGMDFAIQFHNRYEEELARGHTRAAGLIDALTHIGPAVGTAVLATILGFMALLLSAVPAVRDFGALLALGVAILYCLSLVALNALLYRFDKAPRTAAAGATGPLTADRSAGWRLDIGRPLAAISGLSVRLGPIVLAAATALAFGGLAVDHLIPVQTEIEKLIPADAPGVVAMNEVRDATGSSSYIQFLVRADDVTSPEVLKWMSQFQTREIESHPQIVSATSLSSVLGPTVIWFFAKGPIVDFMLGQIPEPIRLSFVTDDHKSASITFNTDPMSTAEVADLIQAMQAEANPPQGVTAVPAGSTYMAASILTSLTNGRLQIALAGFLAVFLGLLAIYRGLRRAVAPVVPIILVTGWSSGAMWLLGIELNPLTAVMSALIVGIGTEFAVLLLARYWEELGRGADPREAMNLAVSRIGRAIAASGLTVVAGFGALLASSFPAIREFGAVTVIDVLLALLATIVVVPPLAILLIRRSAPQPGAVGGG